MVKRIFCILVVLFFSMATMSFADDVKVSDILNNLNLKQGIAYDIDNGEINYLMTTPLVEYKGFSLEGGYSTQQKVVAVCSYQLLKLKDFISLPILDLLEFNLGYFIGFDRISIDRDFGEFVHGPSITLLSVKW